MKNPPANVGDAGSSPCLGRCPGEGNGNPLLTRKTFTFCGNVSRSCLGNPMDRGAWWATVHRVTKSRTQLKGLSTHARTCPTLVTPWTVACQAPLSMGFTKQEYWSGLPFPSPGHLPNPGIEPASPGLAGRFSTFEPLGKPLKNSCSK